MRQAIEEGFILDVLKGYVTYDIAFKLEQEGDDIEVESGKTRSRIFRYVQLHPTAIGQKIAIIVEHFRKHVMHQLNGQAKAMVVTDSRKAAMRYKFEFDKYMASRGYTDFKALVAYSGSLTDPEYGVEDMDEGDLNGGNPKIKDDLIKETFHTDEYRVLLVANKFQVGFDEPLLCAMYVDKRLDNVMAVQTLSRLNRTYPGKTMTFVLDFRNKAEDIVSAFEPYYRTAQLSEVTDRNLPHLLRGKLDYAGVYLWSEVEAFAKLYFSNRNDQAFQAHLKLAYERFTALKREEQEIFRSDAHSYVSAYDFLSQIVEYDDPELEILHAFLKCLLPRLRGVEDDPVLLDSALRLAHYKLVNKREYTIELGKSELATINPFGPGGGMVRDDPRAKLSEILRKIHSLFTGKYSDAEVEGWFTAIVGNTAADERIQEQAKANATPGQFANGDFRAVLADAVVKALSSHHAMSEQMLQNPKIFDDVAEALLPEIYEQARGMSLVGNER